MQLTHPRDFIIAICANPEKAFLGEQGFFHCCVSEAIMAGCPS